MGENRYIVPEGMLKAAMKPFGWHEDRYPAHTGAFCEGVCVRDILEAALQWWSENPIVPTEEQCNELIDLIGANGRASVRYPSRIDVSQVRVGLSEWQRRMFLAPESPFAQEVIFTKPGDYHVHISSELAPQVTPIDQWRAE